MDDSIFWLLIGAGSILSWLLIAGTVTLIGDGGGDRGHNS
jgi:hypothetical protein